MLPTSTNSRFARCFRSKHRADGYKDPFIINHTNVYNHTTILNVRDSTDIPGMGETTRTGRRNSGVLTEAPQPWIPPPQTKNKDNTPQPPPPQHGIPDSQPVPAPPAIEPNQPNKSSRPGYVPWPTSPQQHRMYPSNNSSPQLPAAEPLSPRKLISPRKPAQHHNPNISLQLLDQLDSELGPLIKRLKGQDPHLYKAFMERLHNLYKVVGGAQRGKGDLKRLLEEFLNWSDRVETCDAERFAAVCARDEYRVLLQSKLDSESFNQDWNRQRIAASRYAFENARFHSQMARLEARKMELDNEYYTGAETFLRCV